ncbi:hypothetical protein C7451_12023 [Blastomonas natatoria]|uniref:Uncharacterized protein n=1 Tax=Blastomonas natatoria TaxID=34015 RepID=A0A2V3UQ34_9SPHN|nr:hypothetical protein [Blastomonas natatoria]PXW68163.1 hypothetical protein C7451_12023 [Blastomonas natatoria]
MAYLETLLGLLLFSSLPMADERPHPLGEAMGPVPVQLGEALAPGPEIMAQVRIEQRLIIRVPRQSLSRSSLMAELPPPRRAQRPEPPRFERRKVGKCLSMRDVSGVRVINDDMLVLFMRDQRMIEAQLERSCSAREFYQGFYMERSDDGRLCVDRDLLQARSGSKCEVNKLRQLVPED